MAGLNRRTFLAGSAAGYLTGMKLASGQSGGAGKTLKAALIGCGGYGRSLLRGAFEAGGVDVVAICDVDSAHLEKANADIQERQSKPAATFKDYRKLLEVDDLDVVFIATPPHWHALPFIAACQRGLDIYCEKPVAYDVREGQAMLAAARKAGNIVQIGFQRRSADIIPSVNAYLKTGKPGRIIQAEATISYPARRVSRTSEDPPATLDWDQWCGPAPKLPYSPAVGHWHWRYEKAYGNGHLVDWGIHLIDLIRGVLDEGMPRTIQASGGIYDMADHITTPDVMTAYWEFPTCPVTWRHRLFGAAEVHPDEFLHVTLFGEKETIFITDRQWTVIPKAKGQDRQVHKAERNANVTKHHMANFFDAVRTRGKVNDPLADACQSTDTVLLAMIALDVGRQITWDAGKMRITDDPAAAAMLKRAYRAPWTHPYTA